MERADGQRTTPLMLAADLGHVEITQLLLDRLPPDALNTTDYDNQTALYLAVEGCRDNENCLRCAELLLEVDGVDVNLADTAGQTPLMLAARDNLPQLVARLVARPEVMVSAQNGQGRTALMMAVIHGSEACVAPLMQAQGIDINIRDNDGWTACMHAVNHGRVNSLEALLDAGAHFEVNARAYFQPSRGAETLTALIFAMVGNRVDLVRCLLGVRYIDVNIQLANGCTALILACHNNCPECVELLAERSETDANLRAYIHNNKGWPALKYAVRRGNVKCLEYLLRHKLDTARHYVRNLDGQWSPLRVARHYGHHFCEVLLIERRVLTPAEEEMIPLEQQH